MRHAIPMLLLMAAPLAAGDSLFTASAAKTGTLIAERKARFEIGDIITVLVREKIEASTTADTNTKKESDVQSQAAESANEFFVADDPGFNITDKERLPNWDLSSENETKTTGKTRRISELESTVPCRVVAAQPNGILTIAGQRKVTVNREDSMLSVSGSLRAEDVSPGNTIPSTLLADASVVLSGKGPLWNNQRRGWLTRMLDWVGP